MLERFPKSVHFVGIKGSGMAALASLLSRRGHTVTGSDIPDTFYTDAVLQKVGIQYNETFSKHNIPHNTELVVFSAAYSPSTNAELAFAHKHFDCLSYPQALGLLSREQESWAIIGTHGKTTTTSFIGALCKAHNLPACVLAGTALRDFDGDAAWCNGSERLFAEVCEYKDHFLEFSAHGAIFTSAEHDHPDFFETVETVYESYIRFLNTLTRTKNKRRPPFIIACSDDVGVRHCIEKVSSSSTKLLWYGYKPPSTHRGSYVRILPCGLTHYGGIRAQSFVLHGLPHCPKDFLWYLPMPSEGVLRDAAAALLSVYHFARDAAIAIRWKDLRDALLHFGGIARRSEIIYADDEVRVVDDYAHHPTAIEQTLRGIREFYSPTRLIVVFMSHTFSRTSALWHSFCQCFLDADIVIVNAIYSSARNDTATHKSHTAQELARCIDASSETLTSFYLESFDECVSFLLRSIQPGDVVVTMGAGDNFRISHALRVQREALFPR